MEAQSLGQIAYTAYGEHQAWITFEGKLLPSWESVRPDVQAAWEAAGRAVSRQFQLVKNAAALQASEAGEASHG